MNEDESFQELCVAFSRMTCPWMMVKTRKGKTCRRRDCAFFVMTERTSSRRDYPLVDTAPEAPKDIHMIHVPTTKRQQKTRKITNVNIDIEDIIAARTRRRHEVEAFTATLPMVTPFELCLPSLPLPRGSDGGNICMTYTRRTERNFRHRYRRTHRCYTRENIVDNGRLLDNYDELDSMSFGISTCPDDPQEFKV